MFMFMSKFVLMFMSFCMIELFFILVTHFKIPIPSRAYKNLF